MILAVSIITLSFAQDTAITQFKDELYAETTVVVKDKDKDKNDYDILNEQFDLDDVGMGEVIRIDSGTWRPQEEKVEKDNPRVIKETTLIQEEVASQPVEEAPKKVVKKSSSKSSSSSSVSKGKRVKKKNRWFKPKKRKRFNKRKRYSSCYSF